MLSSKRVMTSLKHCETRRALLHVRRHYDRGGHWREWSSATAPHAALHMFYGRRDRGRFFFYQARYSLLCYLAHAVCHCDADLSGIDT